VSKPRIKRVLIRITSECQGAVGLAGEKPRKPSLDTP
jgi:hypothetical protein